MENNKQNSTEPHIEVFGQEVSRRKDRKFRHHHHEHGMISGLLFLAAGVILLLNNVGVVPWAFWNYAAPFWPVLLVLVGLKIILGHNIASRIIMLLITITVLWCIIVYSLAQTGILLPDNIHPNISDLNNYYNQFNK